MTLNLDNPSHTSSGSISYDGNANKTSRIFDEDIFDAEMFGENAQAAVLKLVEYLTHASTSIKGLQLLDPSLLMNTAKKLMTEEKDCVATLDKKRLNSIIDLYIKTGIQVYSQGYMGRQFSGIVPLAAVIDLVSSIVNQPSSFYEAGQLPNVVERIMADEFNKFVGWERDCFTMITTSGGSLANLTAILAARNDKLPEFWAKGINCVKKGMRPAIAASEEAHYSVCRTAGMLGIGENQIVRLPVNREKQICAEKVRSTLATAAEQGLNVFCMIASAGTTSLGAIDPIDELADIAKEQNIWLHVDGAHGASLLVSDKLRCKLKGIEKADSFTWDAHKMMFVPAMCTLLFYKDKQKSFGAFQQKASYVFEKEPDIYTEYDSAKKNFECTKRPLIMNLWVLWTLYGKKLFSSKVEYLCELTEQAYQIVKNQADFETIHKPESNILCFRYVPENLCNTKFTEFQTAVRNKIRKDGKFFISKVDIDGKAALRVVMMNHEIKVKHFRMLLEEIRESGQSLLVQNQSAT